MSRNVFEVPPDSTVAYAMVRLEDGSIALVNLKDDGNLSEALPLLWESFIQLVKQFPASSPMVRAFRALLNNSISEEAQSEVLGGCRAFSNAVTEILSENKQS